MAMFTAPSVGASNGTWGTELNTALAFSNGVFKLKTSTDTRTTTTLTVDDDIQAMAFTVGTWIIEVGILVSGTAAGDFKMAWAFTGTTTQATRAGIGPSIGTADVLTAAAARHAAAGDTTAAITSSANYGIDGTNWSWVIERGVLVVSVAGNFSIETAQTAASGTTTIQAGSYALARRVA